MININAQNYIVWDTVNNKPKENPYTVYHFTTIIEMINIHGRFRMYKGEELKPLTKLTIAWQRTISSAIVDSQ